jgi:hypothetical protein
VALPVVRNIRVYTLDVNYITVEWELEPTQLDLVGYAVEVWRSESEGGPYQRVSLTMVAADIFDFRDVAVNLLSKWRNFFYRIRVINRANTAEFMDFGSNDYRRVLKGEDCGGCVMEAEPDIFALESIRRFMLVMREFGGRRVLACVERTWGQHCTNCYDHLKRRSKMSGCLTCFDTTYAGGFFQPMEAWCMKPPHQVSVQLSALFEMQADDRVMWFSRYPRLKPRDIIITTEGDRFRCIAMARSEKAQSLTRQTWQIRRLSRDQVEYRIPISTQDWSRNNFTAGAMREHVRATCLESYYKAIGDKGISGEELVHETGDFATHVEASDAPHK